MEQPTSQTLSGAREREGARGWRILKRQFNGLAHHSLARTGLRGHSQPQRTRKCKLLCLQKRSHKYLVNNSNMTTKRQNYITNTMCPLPPNLGNISLPVLVKPLCVLDTSTSLCPCRHRNVLPEFDVYQISLYLTILILYIPFAEGELGPSLHSAFPETFCM